MCNVTDEVARYHSDVAVDALPKLKHKSVNESKLLLNVLRPLRWPSCSLTLIICNVHLLKAVSKMA